MNTPEPITPARSTIDILTAFRFFAIFLIFLSHLDFESYPLLDRAYQRYFYGTEGVSFFFVLSGFILTYNYRTSISSFDWSKIKQFYAHRIARIYPVHVLTFLLSIFVVYPAVPTNLANELFKALANITLTQSLVPSIVFALGFNAPTWSLSDQMLFSLVLPGVLAILMKAKAISPRRALAFIIGICVTDFAMVWLLRDIPSVGLFYISPFMRLFDFCLGALLCFLFLSLQDAPIANRLFTLLELAVVGAFFIVLYFYPYIPMPFAQAMYFLPVTGATILVFAFQRGFLSRILANRLFITLGQISFSFFMFHWLILRFIATQSLFNIANCPWCAASAGFGISLILAFACYQFYETPLRRGIIRLAQARDQ